MLYYLWRILSLSEDKIQGKTLKTFLFSYCFNIKLKGASSEKYLDLNNGLKGQKRVCLSFMGFPPSLLPSSPFTSLI